MAVLQTLLTRAKNSKILKVPPIRPKMAPCAHASHGDRRVNIETQLRLNVASAILKRQGGQDRALYRSIMNTTDRYVT